MLRVGSEPLRRSKSLKVQPSKCSTYDYIVYDNVIEFIR